MLTYVRTYIPYKKNKVRKKKSKHGTRCGRQKRKLGLLTYGHTVQKNKVRKKKSKDGTRCGRLRKRKNICTANDIDAFEKKVKKNKNKNTKNVFLWTTVRTNMKRLVHKKRLRNKTERHVTRRVLPPCPPPFEPDRQRLQNRDQLQGELHGGGAEAHYA